MRLADQGSYFMVGLKNTLGRGSAHPSYKTLIGQEAQATVRPTDGRVFAPGHALAQLRDGETRGIGTAQGRVWAIRRKDLRGFVEWCEYLAKEIVGGNGNPGLPQLGFLAFPQEITRLPDRPLAVQLDDSIMRAIVRVTVYDAERRSVVGDILPFVDI